MLYKSLSFYYYGNNFYRVFYRDAVIPNWKSTRSNTTFKSRNQFKKTNYPFNVLQVFHTYSSHH